MKTFQDLVNSALQTVSEILPWDLADELNQAKSASNPSSKLSSRPSSEPSSRSLFLIDIREPYEYDVMHIQNSLNIPRGILESACDYNYEETVPDLAKARDQKIILICRSGNRSILATYTLQQMGFQNVRSLKTGLRGWNDYDQTLVDRDNNKVDIETADKYFTAQLKTEQLN